MDDRSRRMRIVLAIIVSFFLSQILLNGIFVSKSPRIQSNLIGRYILELTSIFQGFQNLGWTTTTKGIYSKTDSSKSSLRIKTQEVDWASYSYIIKGQTIMVKVPKGENPPSQNFVEQTF